MTNKNWVSGKRTRYQWIGYSALSYKAQWHVAKRAHAQFDFQIKRSMRIKWFRQFWQFQMFINVEWYVIDYHVINMHFVRVSDKSIKANNIENKWIVERNEEQKWKKKFEKMYSLHCQSEMNGSINLKHIRNGVLLCRDTLLS